MAEIKGHPAILLHHDVGPPSMITVCANCGKMRTILFLDKDRWFCMSCKSEGAAAPNLYPIA